ILLNFTNFFKEESCGVCTPCRAGNFILQRKLEKIKMGLAQHSDYSDIRQWGHIMQTASRCGLGKTASNTLLKALDTFPEFFTAGQGDGLNRKFDLKKATEEYEKFKS
ncbi:MAG: NADP oxidoreductase, partial [Phaeodactylibacter sp.]|nr:NADP oxidoreductase [Phaeodactylibacter sp.]